MSQFLESLLLQYTRQYIRYISMVSNVNELPPSNIIDKDEYSNSKSASLSSTHFDTTTNNYYLHVF